MKQINPNQSCQSISGGLSSRSSSLARTAFGHAKMMLSSALAHVKRGIVATLLAARTNWPKYLGYSLIAGAVLAEFTCRAFDPAGGDPLAYWNAYHYLFAIRSDISTILILTGALFLMPRNMKEKWVMIVPGTYKFGRIIWMAMVTSNEQYHALMHWSFLLIGLATSIVWFMLFDYLMALHFHKRQRKLDAAHALLSMEVLDKDFRIQHALSEIVAYKKLN